MTYRGITITKTGTKRYQVREVLGSYRVTEFVPTFKTLTQAKAFIDRMAKS